jgi:hypothetical protein
MFEEVLATHAQLSVQVCVIALAEHVRAPQVAIQVVTIQVVTIQVVAQPVDAVGCRPHLLTVSEHAVDWYDAVLGVISKLIH